MARPASSPWRMPRCSTTRPRPATTSPSRRPTPAAPSTPTDSDGATGGSISEGAATGDAVGITAASTDIHGGTVTFTLSDNAGGRFAIDGSTGVVTVANASLLNYETATSHDITVKAADASGALDADR